MLIIDFETRSPQDIKAGNYLYASHPETEIICCGFKLGEQEWAWRRRQLFYPWENEWPAWVDAALADRTIPKVAHNAAFDRDIWEFVAVEVHGFQRLPHDSWQCSSAIARVNGLPASLDDAARALSSKMRKSYRGAELIRLCSIPPYCEDPDILEEMVQYCLQDLRVTAALLDECRALTPEEEQDWHVNEAINERGVRIDRPLAEAALQYAGAEALAIEEELTRITNGQIERHTQAQRIKAWLTENLPERAIPLMDRYKDGVKKQSIDKAVRAELLGRADELDISDRVRQVIQLTDDGNRSSVSKFQAMLDRADEADRVRGTFRAFGAAQTLRYTAHGLQLHNFIRMCFGEEVANDIRARMLAGEPLESVMDTLSKMLRPTLIPAPGHVFVVGDWSGIESQGLAWLAGHEEKLDLFRRGEDPYLHAAAQIGIDDRQIGKVADLSLGFGGAVGAFSAMGRNFGVHLDEPTKKRVVQNYRRANAWLADWDTGFWVTLKRAAEAALARPGEVVEANPRIGYVFLPGLMQGTLVCLLPGGNLIQYPKARMEQDEEGRWGITAIKASWKPKADATEWPRVRLWHGLLAENATQAFCAALLRCLLRRLSPILPVVMHTHDEVVLEVREAYAEDAAVMLRGEGERPPHWAAGMPLKMEPKIMTRYGK